MDKKGACQHLMKPLTRLRAGLLVEQDLEVIHGVVVQVLLHLAYGLLVGEFAVHETAAARLLHHFRSVVAGDFAKTFAAVDDRIVDDLRVRQQKAAVGCLVFVPFLPPSRYTGTGARVQVVSGLVPMQSRQVQWSRARVMCHNSVVVGWPESP